MSQKDKTIEDIVNYLQVKFGKTEVLIEDNWKTDRFAIGLTEKSRKYLVYISTLGLSNRFYIALENPSADKSFPYSPAGEYNNISTELLEQIVSVHLKLS